MWTERHWFSVQGRVKKWAGSPVLSPRSSPAIQTCTWHQIWGIRKWQEAKWAQSKILQPLWSAFSFYLLFLALLSRCENLKVHIIRLCSWFHPKCSLKSVNSWTWTGLKSWGSTGLHPWKSELMSTHSLFYTTTLIWLLRVLVACRSSFRRPCAMSKINVSPENPYGEVTIPRAKIRSLDDNATVIVNPMAMSSNEGNPPPYVVKEAKVEEEEEARSRACCYRCRRKKWWKDCD